MSCVSRPPIERLQFMAQQLRDGKGLSLRDTAYKFEVSVRTVRRDFDFLTDRLRYRVRYSRMTHSWWLDSAQAADVQSDFIQLDFFKARGCAVGVPVSGMSAAGSARC